MDAFAEMAEVSLAQPEPGSVTLDFALINWFVFVLIMGAVFVFIGLKKSSRWGMYAAGMMVVGAVAWVLIYAYVLPFVGLTPAR